MNNNEFNKDAKGITSHLSGTHVDSVESVIKPKERKAIYKIMVYVVGALVLFIFGLLIGKSIGQ